MYWILLAESLLLTIYVCRLHRKSFAIAWNFARMCSLSGGTVWGSNASLKQVKANARTSVVQAASGFKKQDGKKGTSDGDALAD